MFVRWCQIALGLASACLSATAAPVKVVSFSTVLTEVAKQVGGSQVEVVDMIKPGIDPHEFEPKPADLKLVAQSQLVLLSAKHMEGYVGKLKEALGGEGRIVEVGDQFPSLKMQPADHGGPGHEHGETVEDPHWWHSIANVKRATRVVRDELGKVSPADKAAFATNAKDYTAKLDALQKWVSIKLAELPRDRRKLVTSHDAFQYLSLIHI